MRTAQQRISDMTEISDGMSMNILFCTWLGTGNWTTSLDLDSRKYLIHSQQSLL